MADALDSKSSILTYVWVRVPPPVPLYFYIFNRGKVVLWGNLTFPGRIV
jgi:hypothetical protein